MDPGLHERSTNLFTGLVLYAFWVNLSGKLQWEPRRRGSVVGCSKGWKVPTKQKDYIVAT